MPWWFYVLAVLWSIPALTVIVGVPFIMFSEWRRNRRIEAKATAGAERLFVLTDEYRDRTGLTFDDDLIARGEGTIVYRHVSFDDLGQSGNPRARP